MSYLEHSIKIELDYSTKDSAYKALNIIVNSLEKIEGVKVREKITKNTFLGGMAKV